MYAFESLDAVSRVAAHLCELYHGETALYKDVAKGKYYLVLTRSSASKEDLGR